MPAYTRPQGDPEITARVISTTETHVVVAVELRRDCLHRHRHLLQALVAAADAAPGRDNGN